LEDKGELKPGAKTIRIAALPRSPESPVVVSDGLGEFKQVPEQVFGAEELDPELPGLEVDALGETGKPAVPDIVRRLNPDLLAAGELAGPLEVLHQSGAPERFALKLVPVPDSLEAADERQPIDKERFPGLKAAERMQQVDGPAAADAKELFDERAVDHRGGKGAEGLQNLGKVKQPLVGRALAGSPFFLYVSAQVCRWQVFTM